MCDARKKVRGQSKKLKCVVKHDPHAKVIRHTGYLMGYWYFWETKPKRKKAKHG